MTRHAVVLKGGPLDGQLVSVDQQQNEVVGLAVGSASMGDGVYDRAAPLPLDQLIEERDERDSGLFEVSPLEAAMERLFPNQEISEYYSFNWREQ